MKRETGPLGIVQSVEIVDGALVVKVKPTDAFLKLHRQANLEKSYGPQAD